MSHAATILVMAPNWLGDAVMALPAIADVRRGMPDARLVVAARQSVEGLFGLVPIVDGIVTLQWSGRWLHRRAFATDAARLSETGAHTAILLPNSFAAAWLATRAGIAQRWGYSSDMRRPLLARAIPKPRGSRHQAEYYQHLTRSLGFESGPLEPSVSVNDAAAGSARALLTQKGWDAASPPIVFAPGAAYGTAKQWLLPYVARVMTDLVRDRRATCVIVGGRGDAAAAADVISWLEADVRPRVIDLTGHTSIEALAGVLSLSAACVANDSGAMHVAAAIGIPVVALFGPTREHETAPLTRPNGRAEVLTHPVWCRPCMLRECPIDHRCMTGIAPERVYRVLTSLLSSTS